MSTDARSTAIPDTTGRADTPERTTFPGTGSGTDALPAASPPRPRPGGAALWVLTGLAGLLALVAAVLLPFAPVLTHDTTVTWPQAGKAPTSTTAFFVPYAPESVRVDVPCPVVRAALARSGPTTIVSTDRPGGDTNGFAVTVADGSLLTLVGGRQLERTPVPAGDACGLVLTTDTSGSTVRVGDAPPRAYPGDRVRTVRVFATDLSPADATGLRVQARTADWFTADATRTKTLLATAQVLLAGLSLVLLAVALRERRPGLFRARLAESWTSVRGLGRKAVDVLVLAVLFAWTVLGPLSPDDGFTEGIVRNAAGTDQFGNLYRWENASEAPFTLVLRLVQPLVDAGANPLVLRVPGVVAGVLVWLLVSRVALPVLLPRYARRAWVRLLLAVALLAWWMPFDLGIRPEPFAALAVTATVAFALRAAARPRRAGAWLGLAALSAGVSLAVTPSSVMVAGPVLVLLPALLRRLRGAARGFPALLRQAAGACAAAGLAAVGLTLMFGGQSWYTVTRATAMHEFYGPNVPWFEEIRRYELLLGFDADQGGMGRRLPVLLTIALLVAVLPLVARGVHRTAGMPWVPVVTSGSALGLLVLWLTPSKWTHYFGTLAGVGALAVTCGVVLLVAAARRRAGETPVRAAAAAGTVVLVLGTAVAFSGENNWFIYSHWGVPHDDGPFRPLNTPVPWVLLVAVLLVVPPLVALAARRGTVRDAFHRAVVRAPALLTAVVAATTVGVLLWSFVEAPIRQADSYSVGGQMLATLTGKPTCGLLDHVVTTLDTPGGTLTAGPGTAQTVGFTANGGYRGTPPSPPGTGGSTYLWGSVAGGAITTGSLTSQWFTLPALRPDQELALDVAGRTAQGNRLALEFAPPGDGTAAPLGQKVLDDTATDPDARSDYPGDRVQEQTPLDRGSDWRTLHVSRSAIPAGAGLVRLRAVDDTTDPGGWLAVTGPRLRDLGAARGLIKDTDRTFVDWSLLWAAPCIRNPARIADGLAEAPDVLLRGPGDIGFAGDVSFATVAGGGFGPMSIYGTEMQIPTRLQGTDDTPQYADWGRIVRVTYAYAKDAYDTAGRTVERWGWEGDTSPLGYPPVPVP